MPVSVINDIRRSSLEFIANKIYDSFKRTSTAIFIQNESISHISSNKTSKPKISLLLNTLNFEYDYFKLENVNNIYIPLKYFINPKYESIINILSKTAKIYVYLPSIIRKTYMHILKSNIAKINNHKISGFVISNLSHLELIEAFDLNKYELIGNYTLNIYNSHTSNYLYMWNIQTSTISPELDKDAILKYCKATNINKEMIVYGNLPVMTMNYCPLGKSNKCYDKCDKKCIKNKNYFLKDRLGMMFRMIPDNSQTITTLYNSKILSIDYSDFDVNFIRIDILDENIEKINEIISTIANGKRYEGKEFTNGNLNREI